METPKTDNKPLAAAVTCFGVWGLMPFLFQAIGRAGATPWETLCWRTLAAAPVVGALVLITRAGGDFLSVFVRPRTLALLTGSALLIGVNWGVYIWAVEHHQTLSASLGYYINPLFNMAVAAALFRERVGAIGKLAIALAVVGVALQAWALGGVPWVSILLAVSFGGYSVIRKVAAVEAQTGLLVECLILGLPLGVYLAVLTAAGQGSFGDNAPVTWLLLASGPATVLPLVTFAYAARRLPLTAISFLQFITPSMLFVIGALQHELMNAARLASFAFIWAGVGLYAWGAWRAAKTPRQSASSSPA